MYPTRRATDGAIAGGNLIGGTVAAGDRQGISLCETT